MGQLFGFNAHIYVKSALKEVMRVWIRAVLLRERLGNR